MIPSVKIVSKDERDKALDIFTMAFVDDPVMRWLMPESSSYLKNLGAAQASLGGRALLHETAHCLEDGSAAAFWLPPNVGPDEEAMAAFIEHVPSEKVRGDIFGLVEQMGKYHPQEPHWYLAVLGVDVHSQGKGLGSVLMKHALTRVDREKLPAYLESSNPRNIPFYERHGFEVIGRIQAGSSPVVTPMLRRPR
ncbi:MAG: GNAT family N-acetyltransferase [Alphaproteobacteria bacterium]|nr:GNAT family N-acetyltransferase [Alphaproteobacteria bacterium]